MDSRISDFILSKQSSGVLFVLKGYSLASINISDIRIADTIKNKITRLLQLTQQEQQVISFDEFICLYELLLVQYKRIFIIENPIYHIYFPVLSNLEDHIIATMTAHFDDEADENVNVGELGEYTNIYSNFIKIEQGLACSYNIDDNILRHEKIERLTFSVEELELQKLNDLGDSYEYVNLCTDLDYFQLTKLLLNHDTLFAVTWDGYINGKETIKQRLDLLNAFFPSRLYEYIAPTISTTPVNDLGVATIMKQYWGFPNFLEVKVYEIDALDNCEKKVLTISQERIINDLLEQVERCVEGKGFRDVFVTAPTGAGKSLMFQLPAMYIAEKYNLVTLVITPLIGLMNDQVQALEKKGYRAARTINSDISPIIKQEILDDVANGSCHILYLSPESLLSRSDINQLIGARKIGMLVIDEAHIVTTWGKQFRPDYWYLGDHVQKIRRAQAKRDSDPSPFIIATFTATAIYQGREDMYHETINSLHMIDPITYLGYVKRENINIEIDEVEVKKNKIEYEINKFDSMVEMINMALMRNQKTLIYFPTVALINRFHDYCYSKNLSEHVTKYHGQMDASDKDENSRSFRSGQKMVMLATKAFGMGIDIPDIAIVSHFAPTGNVCDYMQEIGRAARKTSISGHAIYKHMSNDFKHINRLHGLSAIQKYQLVEVIKKILEIYTNTRYKNSGKVLTKKRNEMLIDAESFSYIFESPQSDDNELINKVKTAMLLIQKDYENRGFAPFYMRPIPLFAYGYFSISPIEQEKLNRRYRGAIKLIHHPQNVCEVNLKRIWEKSYCQSMSFPKFKYLLYTKSTDLDISQKYNFVSAMMVEVFLEGNGEQKYREVIDAIKEISHTSVYQGKYFSIAEIVNDVSEKAAISRFRAESIVGVVIAAMGIYQKEYSGRMNAKMYQTRVTKNGSITYQFLTVAREFFIWLNRSFQFIIENVQDQKIYIVNDKTNKRCKEVITILGVLEAAGALRFKSLGGANSQIYIYVNETKNMQMVRDKPNAYRNKLLEMINSRHSESVKMLTFLFQSQLPNDEIWDHLENYFLGILPEELLPDKMDNSNIDVETAPALLLQIGENLKEDYSDWAQTNMLFDNRELEKFDNAKIPLATYYAAKLIIGDLEVQADLVWEDKKIVITNGEETEFARQIAESNGWVLISLSQLKVEEFVQYFEVGDYSGTNDS